MPLPCCMAGMNLQQIVAQWSSTENHRGGPQCYICSLEVSATVNLESLDDIRYQKIGNLFQDRSVAERQRRFRTLFTLSLLRSLFA